MQENRAKLPRVNKRTRQILDALEELGGDNRVGVQRRLANIRDAIDRKADP